MNVARTPLDEARVLFLRLELYSLTVDELLPLKLEFYS